MTKRDNLLKIGGIILFVMALIQLIASIIYIVNVAPAIQLIGDYADMMGVGSGFMGAALFTIIFSFILVALNLLAGLLGFKGHSLKACKVLGIFLLVFGILGLIGAATTIATNVLGFIATLIGFVANIIYVIGAFRSEQ